MYFSENAFNFYKNLKSPRNLPHGVEVMNPYKNENTLLLVEKFFKKYFSDIRKRTLVLGINPGRFGGGYTGINFTDGFALEKFCGIKNNLDKRRELSSAYIYQFINEFGGPKDFYNYFFLSAISPLGFLKSGLNYNYYDDKNLEASVKSFIVDCINSQIKFGINREAVILFGAGKNKNYFEGLNKEYGFFKNILTLEHPRYIMQYKRKLITSYFEKYAETFNKAKEIVR